MWYEFTIMATTLVHAPCSPGTAADRLPAEVLTPLPAKIERPTVPVPTREHLIAVAEREFCQGASYFQRGEYLSAEAPLLRALSAYRLAFGSESDTYIRVLHLLGSAYSCEDKVQRAEEVLQRALALAIQKWGRDNQTYLSILNSLGGLYLKKQDFDHARPILEEVVGGTRRLHGQAHPFHAAAVTNLGFLHLSAGDHNTAEPLLMQGLEIYKARFGEKAFGSSQWTGVAQPASSGEGRSTERRSPGERGHTDSENPVGSAGRRPLRDCAVISRLDRSG